VGLAGLGHRAGARARRRRPQEQLRAEGAARRERRPEPGCHALGRSWGALASKFRLPRRRAAITAASGHRGSDVAEWRGAGAGFPRGGRRRRAHSSRCPSSCADWGSGTGWPAPGTGDIQRRLRPRSQGIGSSHEPGPAGHGIGRAAGRRGGTAALAVGALTAVQPGRDARALHARGPGPRPRACPSQVSFSRRQCPVAGDRAKRERRPAASRPRRRARGAR
jgi:hypothetical protein